MIVASSARRRSRLALAVAPLAAGLLLASCASAAPPAAVVNGHRISVQALESEALFVARARQQPLPPPESLPDQQRQTLVRDTLTNLVRQEITREYARVQGLAVTPQEVEGSLRQLVTANGGRVAFDKLLKQRGLTLQALRGQLPIFLLETKVRQDVLRRLGVASGPDQAQAQKANQAFTSWMARKLAAAEIQVNPRFGRFDPRTGTVVAITSTAG